VGQSQRRKVNSSGRFDAFRFFGVAPASVPVDVLEMVADDRGAVVDVHRVVEVSGAVEADGIGRRFGMVAVVGDPGERSIGVDPARGSGLGDGEFGQIGGCREVWDEHRVGPLGGLESRYLRIASGVGIGHLHAQWHRGGHHDCNRADDQGLLAPRPL
jgi:hypothetical protein